MVGRTRVTETGHARVEHYVVRRQHMAVLLNYLVRTPERVQDPIGVRDSNSQKIEKKTPPATTV